MPAESPSAILHPVSAPGGQLNFADMLTGISLMPSVLTLLQENRRERLRLYGNRWQPLPLSQPSSRVMDGSTPKQPQNILAIPPVPSTNTAIKLTLN